MAEGKILVVDDEKVIRDLFTKVLGNEGYEVVTAKDGDEALNVFAEGTFNLVMMDIRLPGRDGVELLKQLREMDPDIEGMIITGHASIKSAINSLKNGASEYITKPFDRIENVVRVVNRLADKQKLTLENKRLQEETQRQRDELKERVFELGVLYDVSEAISYTLDYKQLFELIMASLSEVVDYDVCASFLFTEKNVVIKADKAVTKDFVEEVKENVVQTFSLLIGQTIGEGDISVSMGVIPGPGKGKKALSKVRSFFNIPLIVKDETIGMLNVSSSRENAFTPGDIRILYTISNQAAAAIGKLKGVIATEKSKMEAMVESMAEGVIMTDGRGGLVVLNPAAKRLLGFDPGQEVTNEQLIQPFREAGKEKLFAKGIGFAEEEEEEEEEEEATTEIHVTDPEPGTLYAAQSLVKDDEGKGLGFVTILRDITREKEIDRMKTEFISTVSHELRTPLTSMKNVVSNISAGVTGKVTKKLVSYLSMMNEDIDRLSRLIGNLLDISRIESGKVELRKSLVDTDALAKRVISNLKLQADRKKIELKITSSPDLGDMYIDADRVSQVFTNLIGNAIKFTPERGKVTVAIEDKDEQLQCSVTDTGIGIPNDELDNIFDKFHQVGRTDGPGAKGTGLGLPITRELIAIHKGRIWAESELGKGSRFLFTLPKTDSETILREYLNNGMTQAKKHGIPMSLIVIGLANFDQIRKDHKVKETVKILKQVQGVITETLPGQADIVSRYHKGEIVITLLEAGRRDVIALEKRLKRAVKTHEFALDGEPIEVEVSFGIATYPEEAQTEDELVKKMEASLEERKSYKPRIMVVDDEPDLCKGLKIILEARNYQVITSHSGQEALEELNRGYLPDLIVLDLMMPVMDGYELYMLLKEKKETQDVPVLVLTAKGERVDKRLGMEFDSHNYITKPFEHKELLVKIKEMIE